jgi:tRNA-dihydrouridine synthase
MSCDGNNATPPGPAIAPGAEGIDPRRAAEAVAAQGMDPRVRAVVPAFDAPFFQAGLCGYSDAAMRIVARRHGCPFCVTEALLDRTVLAGGRGFAKADLGEIEDNVPGGDEDHPLAGQIMGSDPREMAAAALKMVEQAARAEKEYRRLAYVVEGVHPSTNAAAKGQMANGQRAKEESRRIHLRLPGGVQIGWFDPTADLDDSHASSLRPSVPSSLPPRTFATIDVNLACPVKKIDRKARGGHWLAEPAGAIAIMEAVREAVPATIPCTVKLRRAYDDTPEMAAAFDRILEAAAAMGYAWATVHGRTVEQKYVGPSRWDLLRDIVARHPRIPVLGSGDIWAAADIFRMVAYTGVAAAAVARGCIGNPWIFRQARALMAGKEPTAPTIAEQREVLEEHFRLALAVNAHGKSAVSQLRRAEAHTGKTMRKFGIRFADHHPRAEEVRKRFIAVASLDGWRAVLEEFYSGDATEVTAPASSSPAPW